MFYIIRFGSVSKCNLFHFNDWEAGAFLKAEDHSLLGQRTLRAVEVAYEQFGKGILVPSTSEHQGSTKRRRPGCFESSNKLHSSQRICHHHQALEIQRQVWNNTCSQQICLLVEGDRCMRKSTTKYIQDLDWSQSSGGRYKRWRGGKTLHGGVTLELNLQLKDVGPWGVLCWRKESFIG